MSHPDEGALAEFIAAMTPAEYRRWEAGQMDDDEIEAIDHRENGPTKGEEDAA